MTVILYPTTLGFCIFAVLLNLVAYGWFWIRRKHTACKARGIAVTMFTIPVNVIQVINALLLMHIGKLNCFGISVLLGTAHVSSTI